MKKSLHKKNQAQNIINKDSPSGSNLNNNNNNNIDSPNSQLNQAFNPTYEISLANEFKFRNKDYHENKELQSNHIPSLSDEFGWLTFYIILPFYETII